MQTFLVVTAKTPFPEEGLARLRDQFPDNYQITDNAWVLRTDSPTTSREVAHAIFPPDEEGRGPRMLVVRFDGYGGYHQPSAWEWLRTPNE